MLFYSGNSQAGSYKTCLSTEHKKGLFQVLMPNKFPSLKQNKVLILNSLFCLLARVVSSRVDSGCHNFLASVNGPCHTLLALPLQLSSSTSLCIYWDQKCRLASPCDLRIPTYKAHQQTLCSMCCLLGFPLKVLCFHTLQP